MINPKKPLDTHTQNTDKTSAETQENQGKSIELMAKVASNFSPTEYKNVKEFIDTFSNPKNPLKPTDFAALNESLYHLYEIDDDTFISRLENSGLVKIVNGSVSIIQLSQETFTSIIEKLKNS